MSVQAPTETCRCGFSHKDQMEAIPCPSPDDVHPLSPEGRERAGGQHSVPMVTRPPAMPPALWPPLCGPGGPAGKGRHREESVVCLSVGGLVGRLSRGHQETGGLDVYGS